MSCISSIDRVILQVWRFDHLHALLLHVVPPSTRSHAQIHAIIHCIQQMVPQGAWFGYDCKFLQLPALQDIKYMRYNHRLSDWDTYVAALPLLDICIDFQSLLGLPCGDWFLEVMLGIHLTPMLFMITFGWSNKLLHLCNTNDREYLLFVSQMPEDPPSHPHCKCQVTKARKSKLQTSSEKLTERANLEGMEDRIGGEPNDHVWPSWQLHFNYFLMLMLTCLVMWQKQM